MARTQSDFTAEQREAIEQATGLHRSIQGKAREGTLRPGLAGFRVSLATISEWRTKAEQRRRLNETPRANLNELEHQGVEALRLALEQIVGDGTEPVDLGRLRQWTGAYRNLRQAYDKDKSGPIKTEPGHDDPSSVPSLLARLGADSEHAGTNDAADSDETTDAA